jgi:hypothetical protein
MPYFLQLLKEKEIGYILIRLDLFRVMGNYVDSSFGVEFRRSENSAPETTGRSGRRLFYGYCAGKRIPPC